VQDIIAFEVQAPLLAFKGIAACVTQKCNHNESPECEIDNVAGCELG